MPAETLARVRGYFNTLAVLDDQARNFSEWKLNQAGKKGGDQPDKKEIKEWARTALEDIYFGHPASQWGRDGEVFENLISQARPYIEKANEANKNGRGEGLLTIAEHIKTAVLASRRIKKLEPSQRARLLEIAGYEGAEASNLAKKLGISLSLTAAEYSLLGVALYSASGSAALNPFLSELPEAHTVGWVAASYAYKYLSLFANSFYNSKLLENKHINNSPNIFSTGAYYILKKIMPGNENAHRIGTTAAASLTPTISDAAWAPALLIPGIGPSIIAARNVAGGSFYAAELALKKWWLNRKGRPQKADAPGLAT